jgi:hypothetical protein
MIISAREPRATGKMKCTTGERLFLAASTAASLVMLSARSHQNADTPEDAKRIEALRDAAIYDLHAHANVCPQCFHLLQRSREIR